MSGRSDKAEAFYEAHVVPPAVDTLALAVRLDEILAAGSVIREEDVGFCDDYGLELEAGDDFDLGDFLNSHALEIYASARLQPFDFDHSLVDIRSVTVVTGTGGPHTEFVVDYRGNVQAFCYWGGDTAERRGQVESLGDYLVEWFGGWDS